MVTSGHKDYCGNSRNVQPALRGVDKIYSTYSAFSCIGGWDFRDLG